MERVLRKTLRAGSFGRVDAQHSRRMAAIRGKDTSPERIVRSLLHSLGYRFRLHRKDLPGRPDIVLPKHRIAVFVHGCFWHGHTCRTGSRVPRKNPRYWKLKRGRNQARHRQACSDLARLEWRVITIWECGVADLVSNPARLRALLVPRRRPKATRSRRKSAT